MKLSPYIQAEKTYVETLLGNSVICKHCKATLATYADACIADLGNTCSGFWAIEKAKDQYKATAKDSEAME